jgi:hypothetical protein
MATSAKESLYERLGGVYNIADVVDDFIDRIMVDPRLNANPAVDEAHHRVSKAGFKYLVTEMLWLGRGRSATIFWTLDVRLPCASQHLGARVGFLYG